jgi:hypothetical protein
VSVIVIEFITLDGIVSDPDGSGGTLAGGWAFQHGPEAVAGDKFRLGSTLDNGVLLLGRKTWQLFSRIWPGRDDPFSARMNAVPKLLASRTLTDAPTPRSCPGGAGMVTVMSSPPRAADPGRSGRAAADQPDGRGDEQPGQREQPAALDPLERRMSIPARAPIAKAASVQAANATPRRSNTRVDNGIT